MQLRPALLWLGLNPGEGESSCVLRGKEPLFSVAVHMAYGVVRATIALPFRRGRGKDRFLRAYAGEGLLPVLPRYRTLRAGFERCLGCGLCDHAVGRSGEIMPLVLAWRRAPETWPALASAVQSLGEVDWVLAEQACPVQVPLFELMTELSRSIAQWEKPAPSTGARDSSAGP